MAKEDASNGIRGETGDNRVKERRWIRQGIAAVVAGEDVANNPCTLVFLLTGFKLFNQVLENARLVRVGEVEIIEYVVLVPLFDVSRSSYSHDLDLRNRC